MIIMENILKSNNGADRSDYCRSFHVKMLEKGEKRTAYCFPNLKSIH